MEKKREEGKFSVVGVLGLQGSGKSLIMSLLGGKGVEKRKEGESEEKRKVEEEEMFDCESKENKWRGEHKTEGIQLSLNLPQKLILLDSQPLLSLSLYLSQINKEEKREERKEKQTLSSIHTQVKSSNREISNHSNGETPNRNPLSAPPFSIDVEGESLLSSLKMASFLFSVCHIVILVQEQSTQLSFLKFIKTLQIFHFLHFPPLPPSPPPSPSPSSLSSFLGIHPKLVSVHNKVKYFSHTTQEEKGGVGRGRRGVSECTLTSVEKEGIKKTCSLLLQTNLSFPLHHNTNSPESVSVNENIVCGSEGVESVESVERGSEASSIVVKESVPSFFHFLPFSPSFNYLGNKEEEFEEFEESISSLRNSISHLSRVERNTKTLREWLKFCHQQYHIIHSSPHFSNFSQTLSDMQRLY